MCDNPSDPGQMAAWTENLSSPENIIRRAVNETPREMRFFFTYSPILHVSSKGCKIPLQRRAVAKRFESPTSQCKKRAGTLTAVNLSVRRQSGGGPMWSKFPRRVPEGIKSLHAKKRTKPRQATVPKIPAAASLPQPPSTQGDAANIDARHSRANKTVPIRRNRLLPSLASPQIPPDIAAPAPANRRRRTRRQPASTDYGQPQKHLPRSRPNTGRKRKIRAERGGHPCTAPVGQQGIPS